jgi:2-methylisocitrate lyase-like PEP mutase family enzyme
MNKFETFLQLHHNEELLLLGNAWDVTGAKILEQNGFKAIATSSRAIALSLGYEDGEQMPFNLLHDTVKRIVDNITVPLSVDLETGYSRNTNGIIQNIERLYDLGVVGFNIEDSMLSEKGKLQNIDAFTKTINTIVDHLEQKNMKMFVNARTDTFLQKLPNALQETVSRVKAFENAGASGVFVPFVNNKNDIAEIVKATNLPLNILSVPTLPSIKELNEIGVTRISMGSSMFEFFKNALNKKLQTILMKQSFDGLYE